ncbi:helix-turn-helix domain-containing protein [Nocardiopsis changdeensis]|uniref:Helix-turn-helix transcriptional regulator n=1 Tax=Nocardiopsis changdeensis TaxID=2831969 RepID=A0ABX8BEB7_9ACTN|nr:MULTISPECIES: helix-turn-helix transcriptional regulator [Nocardiopsis]QUX20599.1 helix-turn-helix transcriptional regulator [Nocardiopsis changdeensis]QYX36530.1 helix-turn-helix domain-containing protein [Nocardiopsis sp. MT53]
MPEVRRAVGDRDPSELIRLLRRHTDLSQTALARMAGISQPSVSGIVSGKTTIKHLDKVKAALEGLGALRQPGSADVSAFTDATSGSTSSSGNAPGKLEDVKRRDFLEVAGTSVITAPLINLPGFGTDTTRVTPGELDEVHQAAAVFSSWDHTYGGAGVRAAVTAHLRWAVSLLDRTIPSALREDTFSAVARLAMVCGFMAFDAYAHDEARRMFTFATRAAEEANDWHLRAKVLSHRSRQEIWCGDPEAGLTFAELALVRSDRLSPPEVAMLLTARARAFAKLRDTQQTLTAVAHADEAFAAQGGPQVPEWMAYYDAAQHAGDTGHALWDLAVENLHPAKPAHDRLQSAVEGHSDAYRRSRAISGIKLASLQTRSDTEQGQDTALRALDDMGQVRSRRAEDDLRELATTASDTAPELSRLIMDRIESRPRP